MKGYIQIYTGKGKGKTTAALGLTMRIVGAGGKVFIGQFLKSGDYSEMNILNQMSEQVTVEHYGLGQFVKGNPSQEDIEAGLKGYERIKKILQKGEHDLVILDEGNVALMYNILSEKNLLDLFTMKPEHVELLITGRGATQALIDKADLVIEMTPIKHYYEKNVQARVGIEK